MWRRVLSDAPITLIWRYTKFSNKIPTCKSVLVSQSCLTLCDPMYCSPPGSSVHGIFQARILEWVLFPSPGDFPHLGIEPGVCRQILYHWATREWWSIIDSAFLFSNSVVSDSLPLHGLQHTRLPCPSLSLGVCSNSCPLSWWCHPTTSSCDPPPPASPPDLNLFQHQGLFQWAGSLHQVAKVLELQHQSFQWTIGADIL